MKFIKTFFVVLITLVISISSAACNLSGEVEAPKNYISENLGIDVSWGEVITNTRNHCPNGDGTTYIFVKFSDDSITEQIDGNNLWCTFPLNDTVETLVYGKTSNGDFENGDFDIAPYFTSENGEALLPKISHGYYRLIDRQTNTEDKEKDILERYSLNITLAIYDSDTNILYFCEYDS